MLYHIIHRGSTGIVLEGLLGNKFYLDDFAYLHRGDAMILVDGEEG